MTWIKCLYSGSDKSIQGIRSENAWRTMDRILDIVQEAVIKTIPKKKKCKKAKWLNEALNSWEKKRSERQRKNGMNLMETEDIKKRWQEYTELYKKDLNDPDNHNDVITHLEPDILEFEVK